MPTVTVHKRSPGIVRDLNFTKHDTHIPAGIYELNQHYFKRNGLEVAWIKAPGHEWFVALWLDPGTPRTWDVSSDADTYDYRRR